MVDSSANQASQEESIDRVGRRVTRLKELAIGRNGEQKFLIEFDSLILLLKGTNKAKLNSYLGMLGCEKPSILCNSWTEVDETTKDKIWETITITYDVPNNLDLKRTCLSYVREGWKQFKTHLTSEWVFGKNKDKSPCDKWTFIDEETWKEFVKSCQHVNFIEKRKRAQEIAAMNKYPHRLSRGDE